MNSTLFSPSKVTRRGLVKYAVATAGVEFAAPWANAVQAGGAKAAVRQAEEARWRKTWDEAIACLAGNVRDVPKFDRPVLFEGAVYPGVWQECGPHEGLVYGTLAKYVGESAPAKAPLAVARNNHMAFFALQREDGQLPASVKLTEVGYGQIQMVVPIAATAWEVAQLTGTTNCW